MAEESSELRRGGTDRRATVVPGRAGGHDGRRAGLAGARASLEAPILIQVPGEVERLLGPELAGVPTPVWWAEVRADPQNGGPELADRYAAELVKRLGGQVWKPAPPPFDPPTGPVGADVAGGNNA
jgi:hypothetical protein